MMIQYDLKLRKYWVRQSDYFSLGTTVALDLCVIDGKLLFYHVISEQIKEKKI